LHSVEIFGSMDSFAPTAIRLVAIFHRLIVYNQGLDFLLAFTDYCSPTEITGSNRGGCTRTSRHSAGAGFDEKSAKVTSDERAIGGMQGSPRIARK
jgi:hypothetical protein